jgi:DNA replication protein DnaC
MLIVTTMQIQPAYLAILGPGGMGKTTLAIATLHHPEIISKYDQRHFISCESAVLHNQLLNIIGVHLHLEPSKQLLKSIIDHFLNCGSTLLVLDNLETAWEDEGRAEVEELLSLLSDVPQLSLLVSL